MIITVFSQYTAHKFLSETLYNISEEVRVVDRVTYYYQLKQSKLNKSRW